MDERYIVMSKLYCFFIFFRKIFFRKNQRNPDRKMKNDVVSTINGYDDA